MICSCSPERKTARPTDVNGAPAPGVTVVAVRDLHDPSRRELSRATATEPPELSAAELFCELWKKKHGSLPDDDTVAELCAALLDAARSEEEAESRSRETAARAGGVG